MSRSVTVGRVRHSQGLVAIEILLTMPLVLVVWMMALDVYSIRRDDQEIVHSQRRWTWDRIRELDQNPLRKGLVSGPEVIQVAVHPTLRDNLHYFGYLFFPEETPQKVGSWLVDNVQSKLDILVSHREEALTVSYIRRETQTAIGSERKRTGQPVVYVGSPSVGPSRLPRGLLVDRLMTTAKQAISSLWSW